MQPLIDALRPTLRAEPNLVLLPARDALVVDACQYPMAALEADVLATIPRSLRDWLAGTAPKRQQDYLAGRYAAACALKTAGVTLPEWLHRDDDGCPQWPAGTTGSISHSGGTALVAVARTDAALGVGVDIESRMTATRANKVARRILAGAELVQDIEPALQVTLTFSTKESLYKALYPITRDYIGFDEVDVVEWDHANRRCLLRLRQPPPQASGMGLEYIAEYAFDDRQVQSQVVIDAPG